MLSMPGVWSIVLLLLCVGVVKSSSFGNSKNFQLKEYSQPEFFILGSPKCGTTSLWDLLVTHTELCKGVKEVNYFSLDSEYSRGTAHYQSFFDTKKCHQHHIDGSPGYLASPTASQRMMQTFTESDFKRKKFIVVLRDPVYRAYSFYNYHLRHCVASMKNYMKGRSMPATGWNTRELCSYYRCEPYRCRAKARFAQWNKEEESLSTFAEYFQDGHVVREHGQYINYLRHWLQYVDRQQLFIINFDTLVHNTSNTANRLSIFLGLHQFFPANVSLPHDNPAAVATEFDCGTRRMLYKWWDSYTEELMYFMHNNTDGGVPHPAEPFFPAFQEDRC